MVKDRKMGTIYELKKERKKLLRDKTIRIISMSDIMPNKGTRRFYRMYVDYENR